MKQRIARLIAMSLSATLIMSDASIASVMAAEEVIISEDESIVSEESVDIDGYEDVIVDEDSVDIEDESTLITDEDSVEEFIEVEIVTDSEVEEIITDEEIVVPDDFSVSLPTGGLMDVEFTEVDYVDPNLIVYDVNELYDNLQELQLTDDTVTVDDLFCEEGAAVYATNWDKYSSWYTYNLLPAKKQIAWKAYYNICKDVLNKNTSYSNAYFGYVSSPGVFSDVYDFLDFFTMFKYSNPQFYFISNGVSGGGGSYSFSMYNNMMNGSKRAQCTTKFLNGVNAFKGKISKSSDEAATLRSIHDTICNLVVYNQKSVDNRHINEQTEYTQSCYSTFVLKSTVCAGYALSLSLLCNDYGIGAQALTSPGHAYNRVRVYDTWYNIDSTWADQSWGIYYGYYLKSSNTYASSSSHIPEEYWNKYLPTCTKDVTSSDYYTPGKPSKPSSTVATPKITISGGKVSISTSTSGAKIYYTTNGESPSSFNKICNVYTGTFKYPANATIKAIAVRDGSYDSAISTLGATSSYKITYMLNGGKNNSKNPTSYKKSDSIIKLKNPSRKGYLFKGWYTDSKFKNKVTSIDPNKAVNVTIYAKWSAIKYTVKFNANGGKGSISSQKISYGKSTALNKNKFTRKGYTFKGWATSKKNAKAGKVKYTNKASVKNLSSKDGATVTLYAVWKKK